MEETEKRHIGLGRSDKTIYWNLLRCMIDYSHADLANIGGSLKAEYLPEHGLQAFILDYTIHSIIEINL